MKMAFKIFINGLLTGLFLQLAVGPVFFYVVNLTLQNSIYDGFAAVLAVTIVDYFYITLSVIGIGKLIEGERAKGIFGLISSIVLIVFGGIIIRGVLGSGLLGISDIKSANLLSSFVSVFILTISNPMTILFFTGIFGAKSVEYGYTKSELYIFGLSVGLATLIFMGSSVIVFSSLREVMPVILVGLLNLIVGIGLIWYGAMRIVKILGKKPV